MDRLILIFSFMSLFGTAFSQTTVKMEKAGGVYTVPCRINGKDTKFIFDTGASDVSVSLEFFKIGVSQGVFKEIDVYPEIVNYQVASGETVQAQKINIREFNIGNLTLYNVEASVMFNSNAPMLLGQSAIEQFGEYTINTSTSTLSINGNENSSIDKAFAKAKLKMKELTGSGATSEQLKIFEMQLSQAKEQMIKDRQIANSMVFEVFEISKTGEGTSSEVTFKYDVTNMSAINYTFKALSQIMIHLDVITSDGRTYTTSYLLPEAVSGKATINGRDLSLLLRGKTPKFYRMYGTVISPLIQL
jgi:clan AA aspartic protease (TIGR02281 family)